MRNSSSTGMDLLFLSKPQIGMVSQQGAVSGALGGGLRQGDAEGAAVAQLARHPEPSAMALNDGPNDRQTQARSRDATGVLRLNPVKRLKEPGLIGQRDAGPGITDFGDRLAGLFAHDHAHLAAGRRVLDGVLDQVVGCLLYTSDAADE